MPNLTPNAGQAGAPHPADSRAGQGATESGCPGLLRIVAAADGGLCRIRLPAGRISAAQLKALADAASRYACSVVELTNRANLQVRGVLPDKAQALIDALLVADLGPPVAGADGLGNLMLSPSAGVDPAALHNIESLARTLLELLQDASRWQSLSPKFSVQLDGGEAIAMLEHAHDVWFSVLPGSAPRFAFGLAGCPPVASTAEPALAVVDAAMVPVVLEAVLELFLELAGPPQTRLRHLFETLPVADFLARLQERLALRGGPALDPADDLAKWRRASPLAGPPLGALSQRQKGFVQIGAMPTLGRLDAAALQRLAQLVSHYGDGHLRLTPWQGVLLTNVPVASADAALRELQAMGLHTQKSKPITQLIACAGSSGCGRGHADTKADAIALAAHLEKAGINPGVHLSGCPRSCAAAHVAPYTLLAIAPSRYDLFARVGASRGFGAPLAHSLTIDEAAQWLVSHHLAE